MRKTINKVLRHCQNHACINKNYSEEKLSHPVEVKNGKRNFQHKMDAVKYTANILLKNILNSAQLLFAYCNLLLVEITMPGKRPTEFPCITTVHAVQPSHEMDSPGIHVTGWATVEGPSCQCNINHQHFSFIFTLVYPVK